MKRVARQSEHKAVVSVPPVVRVPVVAVEPRPIVIAFDVEHVEIAVRKYIKHHPCHCSLNTL
ncbi:MAG: hypothetical protein AAB757_01340 [Patescibacteria group bacterium]|mgnify:CR=1 FL=1